MPRRVTLTKEEATARYDEVLFETARKKRQQRALRNQAANRAYWENLSEADKKAIFAGFENGARKQDIARQVGYPFSFIVYIYTHHYGGST